MKKNIRQFDNSEQLENVICNRARLLLGNRTKQICVNPLKNMMRNSEGYITHKDGKMFVDDDFIAKIAREIKEETLYHDGF